MFREAKYLAAYLIPLATALGLLLGGPWTWATPVLAFGLVPLAEALLGENPANDAPPSEAARRVYDWLLYLNVPLLWTLLLTTLWQLTHQPLPAWQQAGLVVSTGITVGALGVNVGHELGHRSTPYEKALAHLQLISALFLHFYIEHNRGHHRFVATPRDSATARRGEGFYAFLLRAVPGEIRSAFQLEADRLRRRGLPAWSLRNDLLLYLLLETAFLIILGFAFGPAGVAWFLAIATVGVLLFQIVDYVEHYALLRQEIAPGIFERVRPCHSWNADYVLGRLMLYELTRHSDHHYQPARKYQLLRHLDPSPQLPAGYPAMMLLALVPPLWRRIMAPRAEAAARLTTP
ncbi:MAG TPA: alkane 1-monooxygenase [bacterium]|nr:alkane 1-monooxygenase [bacterium]